MSKEIGVASTQRPIQAGIVNILAILIAVPARCTIRLTLPCACASDTAGILQGLGRTVIPMVAIFIGLLAKTFLDYELTGTIELGINGAAWATNLNFAIAALINYIFVKKYVGSVLNKLELLKIAVSAMAMGGATQVIYVSTVELLGNGGAVAAAIVVAVFVYGLSLWLTKAVVKDDMYHFPIIGKRLQARRDKEEAKLYEEQY